MWILVALLGFLAATYGMQRARKPEIPSLKLVPLTSYAGNEVQPGLSPDVNQVPFAFNEGGFSNYHIHLKVIGSEELTRLNSDTADDLSPSWSPDGQSIVFLRFLLDYSASVIVVPSVAGAKRKLANILVDRRQSEIRVTWSPDVEWSATSDAETLGSTMDWF